MMRLQLFVLADKIESAKLGPRNLILIGCQFFLGKSADAWEDSVDVSLIPKHAELSGEIFVIQDIMDRFISRIVVQYPCQKGLGRLDVTIFVDSSNEIIIIVIEGR